MDAASEAPEAHERGKVDRLDATIVWIYDRLGLRHGVLML
jgi:hypothetical protein